MKALTFPIVYGYILSKTNTQEYKLMNIIFFGKNWPTRKEGHLNPTAVSRYKKGGLSRNSLPFDIIEKGDDGRKQIAENLRCVELRDIPPDGNGLLSEKEFSAFDIDEKIRTLCSKEDVYQALARLIVYSAYSVNPNEDENNPPLAEEQSERSPKDTIDFFKYYLDSIKAKHIEGTFSIDMAFHAGQIFFRDFDWANLLSVLIDSGIHIRIIVNTGVELEPMLSQMRHPRIDYDSLDSTYIKWLKLQKETNLQLEVRATSFPLMHRTFLFYSDSNVFPGVAKVHYYSYGTSNPMYTLRDIYTADQPEYNLLKKEFDYLWDNCCDSLSQRQRAVKCLFRMTEYTENFEFYNEELEEHCETMYCGKNGGLMVSSSSIGAAEMLRHYLFNLRPKSPDIVYSQILRFAQMNFGIGFLTHSFNFNTFTPESTTLEEFGREIEEYLCSREYLDDYVE